MATGTMTHGPLAMENEPCPDGSPVARRLVARARTIMLPAVVLGLASCRFAFDSVASGADAPAGDAPLVDIADLGEFGAPTVVTALAHPMDEDDPTLTGDLLYIVIDSSRLGGDALFESTRPTVTAQWSTPARIDALLPSGDDTGAGMSTDGLTLMFTSTRAGGQGLEDIWLSTRADRASAWSSPMVVAELSSPSRDTVPQLTQDNLSVFLASDRPGGSGSYDLYVATRTSPTSAWQPPIALANLNTPGIDIDPHYCEAEDALYFTSDRAGTRDLYRARRIDTWSFATPEPVPGFNSASLFESDPWISPDGRTLFLVTTMSGNREIAVAYR